MSFKTVCPKCPKSTEYSKPLQRRQVWIPVSTNIRNKWQMSHGIGSVRYSTNLQYRDVFTFTQKWSIVGCVAVADRTLVSFEWLMAKAKKKIFPLKEGIVEQNLFACWKVKNWLPTLSCYCSCWWCCCYCCCWCCCCKCFCC